MTVVLFPTEEAMKRNRRRPTTVSVSIDPDLERRWQEALLTRPSDNPAALAAWDKKHGELLATYQTAVDRAQKEEQKAAKTRTRRRRRFAAALVVILLAIVGIVYWTSRPSEDEIRNQQ